ncbi:MAG TPA: M28 family peptidase, partial [Bacteroidia bacterium]|nr:M28 family peptidase [Bacteroidia bacterium]
AFEKFKRKIKSPATFIIADDRQVTDKSKLEYFKKVKGNYFSTIGVIAFSKKLTHTVSQQVDNFTEVNLLTDSFKLDFSALKNCKASLEIESWFNTAHSTQNIISYVEGSQYPDSFIVFSAHYDHLGQMGKEVFFPGANDNASGCSMLLNLARYYSIPANKPRYSIAFIVFAGEEAGLVGSNYYVTHPVFPLAKIKFLLNMDIMGTGDEGITVVNGTLFKNEFDKLVEINKANNFLQDIKIRGKAAISDHYPFSEKGVRTFFIYSMGGIKAYHDVYDKAETLPLTKFEELFKLILRFSDYLQKVPEAASNHN